MNINIKTKVMILLIIFLQANFIQINAKSDSTKTVGVATGATIGTAAGIAASIAIYKYSSEISEAILKFYNRLVDYFGRTPEVTPRSSPVKQLEQEKLSKQDEDVVDRYSSDTVAEIKDIAKISEPQAEEIFKAKIPSRVKVEGSVINIQKIFRKTKNEITQEDIKDLAKNINEWSKSSGLSTDELINVLTKQRSMVEKSSAAIYDTDIKMKLKFEIARIKAQESTSEQERLLEQSSVESEEEKPSELNPSEEVPTSVPGIVLGASGHEEEENEEQPGEGQQEVEGQANTEPEQPQPGEQIEGVFG